MQGKRGFSAESWGFDSSFSTTTWCVYSVFLHRQRGKTVGSVLTSGIKSDLLCVFLPQSSAHSLSARCSFRNGIVLLAL